MPLKPLTPEQARVMDQKKELWQSQMIGRELLKCVRGEKPMWGIIWRIVEDEFGGPPAKVTTKYKVLWDVDRLCDIAGKRKRPLSELLPGEPGVEAEIMVDKQFEDSTIELKSTFSHFGLPHPIKLLQPICWRWRTLPLEQQHELLRWKPDQDFDNYIDRMEELREALLTQLEDEEEASMPKDSQQRRRLALEVEDEGTDGRSLDVQGDEGSSELENMSDEGSSGEDETARNHYVAVTSSPPANKKGRASTKAVQQTATRGKVRTSAAASGSGSRRSLTPSKRGPSTSIRHSDTPRRAAGAGTPTRHPRTTATPARAAAASTVENAVGSAFHAKRSIPTEKSDGTTSDEFEDAKSDAEDFDMEKLADFIPNFYSQSPSAQGAQSPADRQAHTQAWASELPQTAATSQAAADADEACDYVRLPRGTLPSKIPRHLTLHAGDMLLEEYLTEEFPPDAEFEPQYIVSQKPAAAPTMYLVKWKGYELDTEDWTIWDNLSETAVLEQWERQHPPPQGAGNQPPALAKKAKGRKRDRR